MRLYKIYIKLFNIAIKAALVWIFNNKCSHQYE